jgi:hypothetical protein
MNIKDYIHFYLEAEAFFDNKIWIINKIGAGTVRLIRREAFGKHVECRYGECMLILRPLSDMTDEEFDEWRNIDTDVYSHIRGSVFHHGSETKYLLDRHFDLFGLIEAGLAIDKTKPKS